MINLLKIIFGYYLIKYALKWIVIGLVYWRVLPDTFSVSFRNGRETRLAEGDRVIWNGRTATSIEEKQDGTLVIEFEEK